MVDREVTLSWADLTSRKLVERPVTMTCVPNEVGGIYLSTTNFTGVLLADVLKEVRVRRGADQVFTHQRRGVDLRHSDYDADRPSQAGDAGDRNERRAAADRARFPGSDAGPGALRVRVRDQVDHRYRTHHVRRAARLLAAARLGQRAPIKTMSRINNPGAFGRVGEDSAITGVAWAQTKGIEKVEVRLDHGQWQTAEPSTEVNADTWRMFDCGDG
jgi:hypothetical protein